MKVVSWNINHQAEAWHSLVDSDYDIALLQEAAEPPKAIAERIEINPGKWETAGVANRRWRSAIVKLSDRVKVEWISCQPIGTAQHDEVAVSRMGTIAAARVTEPGREPIILFSCYSVWEKYHEGGDIYAEASAHRIISDLSSFLRSNHSVIVAGDWNILNRYGEHGNKRNGAKYASVFDRMLTIGLPFQGPQAPNGRQAHPWPEELPVESKDVPTYYHTRQQGPTNATRQLDFVFCSTKIAKDISVVARNDVDDWGPSDHCRVEIECNL